MAKGKKKVMKVDINGKGVKKAIEVTERANELLGSKTKITKITI
jgi:hypothetical protein